LEAGRAPATVARPHRCHSAAAMNLPPANASATSPSHAPKKHTPAPRPWLRFRQSSIPIPIHHSTTVTLTPSRPIAARPTVPPHTRRQLPLCFHRLSPLQSPECGSLGIVLSSLTGLSEVSMLSRLFDDDYPETRQTDRQTDAKERPCSPDWDRFHVLVDVDSLGRPRCRPLAVVGRASHPHLAVAAPAN